MTENRTALARLVKWQFSLLSLLISCFAVATTSNAQEADVQRWQGILDTGRGKLTLNFEIAKKSGEWSGAFFSVEQGNAKIPLSKIEFDNDQVTIEARSVQAVFKGTLQKDGTVCVGKWKQLGKEYDFSIERTTAFAPQPDHVETWIGTLQVGVKLEIGIKIYRAQDGTETARMDSYSQNVTDIALDSFARKDKAWSFSSKAMKMEFRGEIDQARNVISGTFQQNGIEIPLELTKTSINYAPSQNRPQTPKAPFPYDQQNVQFENDVARVTLAGTLTTPKENGNGPWPAAILISGSGPQDRDETILGHKPFLVIADHLTRNGIAVLRFDDRGTGQSTGDFETATSRDFAKDVFAAVQFLKNHPGIDANKIGLIGHSEGGLIAPMVAADSSDIAFIVSMAGPGVDGGTILKTQTEAILKAAGADPDTIKANRKIYQAIMRLFQPGKTVSESQVRDAAQSAVNEIENEKVRKEMQTSVDALATTLTTPWMQFFIAYDPAPTLKKITCPILAINGSKDLQVLADINLQAIESALSDSRAKCTTVQMIDHNHLFQETDGKGSPGDYGTIEQTISSSALNTISDWVKEIVKPQG